MRKYGKRDSNQKEIIQQLRGIPGVTVADTASMGNGFPDLVIGHQGVNYLVELKDGSKPPSARKLTPDELAWHDQWCGQVAIIENIDQLLQLLGIIG